MITVLRKWTVIINVKWDKKYEIGVEDIDLQHHYFLNLINTLIEAINKNESQMYREALVSELDAYAKFHFKSEERMMLHSNYPQYETHKNHHFALIQQLGVAQYRLTNPSQPEDAQMIIEFLTSWFIEHTTKEDRLFADYLLQSQYQQ